MYTSSGSTASLSEICLSLSQVTCLRSRAMLLRKLSQENHVRRMMIARLLQSDRESPVFVLPSNHPNASKKTPELLLSKISSTKLKYGRTNNHHTQSSVGFSGVLCKNNDCVLSPANMNGRKCSSNMKQNRYERHMDSYNLNKKELSHLKSPGHSTNVGDGGINLNANSNSAFSKNTPNKLRKQVSTFSRNTAGLSETARSNIVNNQAKLDDNKIANTINSISYSNPNASIEITSTPVSSNEDCDDMCSEKCTSNTTSEMTGVENSNTSHGKQIESTRDKQEEDKQATERAISVSPTARSGIQAYSLASKQSDFANGVLKMDEIGDGFNSNMSQIKKPKKLALTRKSYKARKVKSNKKLGFKFEEKDAPVKSKLPKKSFSKNTANSKQNETISIQPTMLLPCKESLGLNDIHTTPELVKDQCSSDKEATTESKEPFPNAIFPTKPLQLKISKLDITQLSSRIPVAISRIERKNTVQLPSETTMSLDSLDDCNKNSDLEGGDMHSEKLEVPYSSGIKENEIEVSCPNTTSKKKRNRQIVNRARQRSSSEIPVPVSRSERKRTNKTSFHTSISPKPLKNQKKNLDFHTSIAKMKAQRSSNTKSSQMNSGGVEKSHPIVFSAKENFKKSLAKKGTGQLLLPKSASPVVKEERKGISIKPSSNSENQKGAFGDIESRQQEGANNLENQSKVLCFTNLSCNANMIVSSWLNNLPDQTEITLGNKHESAKTGGNFAINTVGKESLFKETSISSKRGGDYTKTTKHASINRSFNKGTYQKLTSKSNMETKSCSTIPVPPRSCTPEDLKEREKRRKSVVNTEKLLGKLDNSFSGIEFLDSPIEKFMSVINSAMVDTESDE